MPPPQRITIRLSPVLAAKLAAKVGTQGTLADTVHHSIGLYLEGESPTWQPRQPPVADAADTLAATVADINVRLAVVEQRLTVLQSQPPRGSQRQPHLQPAPTQPPMMPPSTSWAVSVPVGMTTLARDKACAGAITGPVSSATSSSNASADRRGAGKARKGQRRYGLVQRVGHGQYITITPSQPNAT